MHAPCAITAHYSLAGDLSQPDYSPFHSRRAIGITVHFTFTLFTAWTPSLLPLHARRCARRMQANNQAKSGAIKQSFINRSLRNGAIFRLHVDEPEAPEASVRRKLVERRLPFHSRRRACDGSAR
jgi:hypothetical protein